MSIRLIERAKAPITAPHNGYIRLNFDTFTMDNSSPKKEDEIAAPTKVLMATSRFICANVDEAHLNDLEPFDLVLLPAASSTISITIGQMC